MALLYVYIKAEVNVLEMYIKTEICLMKIRNIPFLTVSQLTDSWKKCCYREFNCPPLGFL